MPVSKPKSISDADFTDIPSYERFKADYTDIPNYRRGDLEDMIRDIDDLGTEDRSLDPSTAADLILGRGDAVFDTPTLGNLSRNVRVTRDAPEGDFTFSSAVPVEKLEDLYEENTLEDVLTRQEEKQGLDLLAMFLNAIRPQFTTESAGFEEIGGGEKFPPSTALRSSRFNDGGIVQGFRAGGVAKDRYEDFSSNIRGDVGGRVDIRDIDDLGTEERVSKPIVDADIAFGGSGKEEDDVFSTPYADAGFAKAEANPLNKYVAPVTNFIAGLQTNPNTGQKFDMSNTSDRYDYYNLTQQTKEASERAAEARRRDQDRAERKLAEEQRMRDMIQGMLPPTAATAPTTPVADATTADPATPDYSSVVVPSDRVPGFDVGNISPYPQFRMPTEFSPVFPTSLSANYFKDLFKNIGVQNMQQGGSVNQLDSAIDNFINAYR